ncbi:MAG: D-alanyl-D-alanine carboxypeptidase [Clostridia bacterium]|nr:D-alanyl-D-alanine carboxypeptidase [Clostridia bacterium]
MKKIAFLVSLILIAVTILTPLTASAYEVTDFEVKSEAAMLVSLDTGDIMYQKNVDKQRFPASLTKIMTALVVLENVTDIDKKITVPEYCITSLSGTGATMGNLKAGEELTIRQLLDMTMIISAADAANTLADYVGGGSIRSFVDKMNAKAKELGMDSTKYANVHGLHNDDHYTTPADMYKLAVYATQQPILMEICSVSRKTIDPTNKSDKRILSTTNLLIDPNTKYYYKYAKGIKTGYTSKAGRCLITTASKNGYNYLCIIMGAPESDDGSVRQEFIDSENLYKWAFDDFEYRKIADKNITVAEMKLELCWDRDYLQLYPEKEISAIVPEDIDDSTIIYDPVLKSDTVSAPIKKGDVLGYARIICAGKEIGQVNLIATENYDRNILLFAKKVASGICSSPYFIAFVSALGVLLVIVIIVNIIHNKRKRSGTKRVHHIRKF